MPLGGGFESILNDLYSIGRCRVSDSFWSWFGSRNCSCTEVPLANVRCKNSAAAVDDEAAFEQRRVYSRTILKNSLRLSFSRLYMNELDIEFYFGKVYDVIDRKSVV